MRVRARARQRGVELPLVISDHADWDGLTATIAATGASQIWVTHGAEEALVHWCTLRGLEARPLNIVGYGDEDEGAAEVAGGRGMNRFAALLDRLAYEPSRNAKLRLLTDYFRATPDPDRGYALAAITGALSFRHAKPGIIRALIAERTDPVLFELSYDYVGDLSETVALMWPVYSLPRKGEGGGAKRAGWGCCSQAPHPAACGRHPPRSGGGMKQAPTLSHVVTTLASLGKSELPGAARRLARCARRDRPLGAAEARHRRAAHRRVGAARQDRRRRARRQGRRTRSSWSGTGSRRPTRELFAWIEGRAEKPVSVDPAPFRPVMLSHAIEETDFAALDPARLHRRMEMGRHPRAGGRRRSATASASRGFIRAPARTFPARFPI